MASPAWRWLCLGSRLGTRLAPVVLFSNMCPHLTFPLLLSLSLSLLKVTLAAPGLSIYSMAPPESMSCSTHPVHRAVVRLCGEACFPRSHGVQGRYSTVAQTIRWVKVWWLLKSLALELLCFYYNWVGFGYFGRATALGVDFGTGKQFTSNSSNGCWGKAKMAEVKSSLKENQTYVPILAWWTIQWSTKLKETKGMTKR